MSLQPSVENEQSEQQVATQTPQRFDQTSTSQRPPTLLSEPQLQQIAELFNRMLRQPQQAQPSVMDWSPRLPSEAEGLANSTSKSIKASDIGFFDPAPASNTEVSTLSYNSTVFSDVFVFADMLRHFADTHGANEVQFTFPSCLRGEARFWFSTELTALERRNLTSNSIDALCSSLIGRFKEPPSLAVKTLTSTRFGQADIRAGLSMRAHTQALLRSARSAGISDDAIVLLFIYNSLDMSLRQHLDEPSAGTTISQFLASIDKKWSLWLDLANRNSSSANHSYSRKEYTPPGSKRYEPAATIANSGQQLTRIPPRVRPPFRAPDGRQLFEVKEEYGKAYIVQAEEPWYMEGGEIEKDGPEGEVD